MEYLNIREASSYCGKSISTIRNYVRKLKQDQTKLFKGEKILKHKTLSNKAKQVFILKNYLDSHINLNTSVDMSINTSVDTSVDRSLTSENNMLIDSLKDHIQSLKTELENRNKQIDDFLILEQKAIDRIQEQNHIIHQLNTIVEEKKRKIEILTDKKEKYSPNEYEEVTDFEHIEELNNNRSEILKEVLRKGEKTFNDWLNSKE